MACVNTVLIDFKRERGVSFVQRFHIIETFSNFTFRCTFYIQIYQDCSVSLREFKVKIMMF